jgi:eukaryotic-like serine/threonine-protein kinase
LSETESTFTGRAIGAYRVGKQIGDDALSLLHEATDAGGRRVTWRTLRPEAARDPATRELIAKGASLVRRLRAPGALAVLDHDLKAETPYVAYEPISGRTVRDVLRERGALPLVEAAEVALQVLDVLDDLQRDGVVHGNLTPDHLYVLREGAPGRVVRLGGFDVASPATTGAWKGGYFGTPEYSSPEQCVAEALDGRSDLYSLGIMLFEMLAGRVPFHDKDAYRTLAFQMVLPPPALAEARPGAEFPAEVEALVARALAKDPAERFGSAREMARSLLEVVARRESRYQRA